MFAPGHMIGTLCFTKAPQGRPAAVRISKVEDVAFYSGRKKKYTPEN